MNTARLNFTRLNTSVLNASLLNSSLMGGRGKGSSSRPSGLIAQYKPYLNSNDSPTRDVLKDYSGHGNDITLYNFAFTEESGYNTTTYPGALVSDGVDDYGICENFPILAKEKGYTVVVLRKWIGDTASRMAFISAMSSQGKGSMLFEGYDGEKWICSGFGGSVNIDSSFDKDKLFNYMTSLTYNGEIVMSRGNLESLPYLGIYREYVNSFIYYSSVALYALEIYDRDLTEEEIETVKQRMMAEYEKATGNVLEGVILLEDGTDLLLEDGTSLLME